jgi:lipoprotein-anchoring transpeptidase ErfK/SrfK
MVSASVVEASDKQLAAVQYDDLRRDILMNINGGREFMQQPMVSAPATALNRPPRRNPAIPSYVLLLLLGSGAAFMFLALVLLAMLALAGVVYAGGNILPGVVVHGSGFDDISVGGLSVNGATSRLQSIPVDRAITLRDGSRTWIVSSTDLGLTLDANATAVQAAQAGRADGNLFTGIGTMLNGSQITPVYTIDLARAQTTLTALSPQINVTPGTDSAAAGRTLNVGATFDALPPDLGSLMDSGTLNLVMDVVQGPRTIYTVQRGEELGLISKKFNVPVSDIVALNNIQDANQIYPGQTLIIPAAGVWVPTEKDAPPAPSATGKAIVVSLKNQRIYAYENGHLVHSALMSSGKPGTETVQGDYRIYVKYPSAHMTGPDYDIPDVPWTMYFYQGYGIHGAYWHNDFGREMSHGCVNLETSEAKWFYDFAPVGTLVRVLPPT